MNKYTYPFIYTKESKYFYHGSFPNLPGFSIIGCDYNNLMENAKREVTILFNVSIENNMMLPMPSNYEEIQKCRERGLIPENSICELIEVEVDGKLRFIDDNEKEAK